MKQSDKEVLRCDLRLKRQVLDKQQAKTWSQDIIARCMELIPWSLVKSFHTYVTVESENEVDTWPLLKYTWQTYPKLLTAVPKLNQAGDYDSVAVTAKTEWQHAGVRIPEPKKSNKLAQTEKFDVIIVPMLGFDNAGYRLGHGKGWYDRFLVTQPQALTIGLCYELGHVAKLPHEPHDIPVKYIVTEKQILKF